MGVGGAGGRKEKENEKKKNGPSLQICKSRFRAAERAAPKIRLVRIREFHSHVPCPPGYRERVWQGANLTSKLRRNASPLSLSCPYSAFSSHSSSVETSVRISVVRCRSISMGPAQIDVKLLFLLSIFSFVFSDQFNRAD